MDSTEGFMEISDLLFTHTEKAFLSVVIRKDLDATQRLILRQFSCLF